MTDTKPGWFATYFRKFKGQNTPSPHRVKTSYIFWSALASFVGIFTVASLTIHSGVPMMIGSFGASAVLLYSALEAPLSQPRNLIGGHVISALIAVTIFQLFGRDEITIALAVSISIAVMLWTRTLHPPGGATALIAVDSGQGYTFVLFPVLAGAIIMLLVALAVNNLSEDRSYPRYWI
ncbi:MAG: HPP family protein [Nitrospinae bacterium]|nr:HPP family protein [Nitrospinota bacterium]